MWKWIRIVALAALFGAACQLSSAPTQPTPTLFVPSQTPFIVTATPLPNTPTPNLPTATPRSTGNTGNPQCFVRTDWQVYVVQPGETLGTIAARVNSTANALALGNCLTNVNTIFAGQQLRVPFLPPPTATRTPLPIPPTFTPVGPPPPTATALPFPTEPVGSVMPSDFISGDAGNFILLRGERIVLSWNAPPNMANATFYAAPPGVSNPYDAAYVIGTDNTPWDGLFTQWDVPVGMTGYQLLARGLVVGGSPTQSVISYPMTVYSAHAPEIGCFITSAVPSGVPIHQYADAGSTIVGTLTPDVQLQVMGRAINGWYAYDPGNAAANGTSFLRWIPVSAPVTLIGQC